MNRRTFLSLTAAAVASTAGCTGRDAPAATNGSGRRTATPASPDPATDATGIRVENPRIRADLVVPTTVHRTVRARPDRQYLVVTVIGPGTVDPGRFSLVANGGTVAGSPVVLARNRESPTTPVELAFPVADDADPTNPRVVHAGGTDSDQVWSVPPATAERLSRAVRFQLVSFSVPETAADGDRIGVEVAVENAGGRAGTFRALLGTYDPGSVNRTTVSVDVPAGGTARERVDLRVSDTDGDGDVVVFLSRGDAERTRTVRVE